MALGLSYTLACLKLSGEFLIQRRKLMQKYLCFRDKFIQKYILGFGGFLFGCFWGDFLGLDADVCVLVWVFLFLNYCIKHARVASQHHRRKYHKEIDG